MSVSEIAIIFNNNKKVFEYLLSEYNLNVFSGSKDVLEAIGDDEGLFICMNKTKRKWFPTGEETFCSGFEVEFEEDELFFLLKYKEENLIRLK